MAHKHAEKKRTDIHCPRDKSLLASRQTGDATLDVCGKCGGEYFDSGEMFKAFGMNADPSYWDRKETGGVMKDGELHCPQCHSFMLVQDVTYDSKHVEIDRCGKCGGIWLDKGEVQTIMTISEKLWPVLDAERRAAQAEADKIPADFGSPGLIGRFLKLFQPGG